MSMRPELTPLDRRVLSLLYPLSAKRCVNVYDGLRRGLQSQTHRTVTERDVYLILRGLEHWGFANNNRGWWRRTERGDMELAR